MMLLLLLRQRQRPLRNSRSRAAAAAAKPSSTTTIAAALSVVVTVVAASLLCLFASSSSTSSWRHAQHHQVYVHVHVGAFQPNSLSLSLATRHLVASSSSSSSSSSCTALLFRQPTSTAASCHASRRGLSLSRSPPSGSSSSSSMALLSSPSSSSLDQQNNITTAAPSSSSSGSGVMMMQDVPLYDPSASTTNNSASSSSSSPTSSFSDMSFNTNNDKQQQHEQQQSLLPPLLQKLVDKVGKIDESRIVSSPEYLNGDVPQLFSNLQYETTTTTTTSVDEEEEETRIIIITKAKPASSGNYSTLLSSSSLLCGTALGTGILYLPTAIYTIGYLPAFVATCVAWGYMTISALLTSELLINRYGETGRVRNVGLLELYDSYLGGGGGDGGSNVTTGLGGGTLASLGFLIVSYIVMGVYLSEGGDQLMNIMELATNAVSASSSHVMTAGAVIDGGMLSSSSSVPQDVVAMAAAAPFSFANNIMDNSNNNNNADWLARALFATIMGAFLSTAAKYNIVQRVMTNIFVPMTLVAILGAICIGWPTADIGSLTSLSNQHPEVVLNAFPLLFMSWTYHGVVPRVVYDLEGDKNKITLAIIAGSTTALLIYLIWNAMILGNMFGSSSAEDISSLTSSMGSIATAIEESSSVVMGDLMLGAQGNGDDASASIAATFNNAAQVLDTTHFKPLLQSSIAIVSELAVVTSLIGVVLGFVNEFNDAVGRIPSSSSSSSKSSKTNDDEMKWKVALLTLLPPAIVSVALGYFSDGNDVNNYQIIDYTGIFGSSILFLILPALMAWQNRYGEGDDPPRPLTVRPMVPLGKIPLGSLYKAAGTLIVEQGLDKLGVFEFVKEHIWKT